ncbi:13419_t:CDS:2, partial [Racocetra persica]
NNQLHNEWILYNPIGNNTTIQLTPQLRDCMSEIIFNITTYDETIGALQIIETQDHDSENEEKSDCSFEIST